MISGFTDVRRPLPSVAPATYPVHIPAIPAFARHLDCLSSSGWHLDDDSVIRIAHPPRLFHICRPMPTSAVLSKPRILDGILCRSRYSFIHGERATGKVRNGRGRSDQAGPMVRGGRKHIGRRCSRNCQLAGTRA